MLTCATLLAVAMTSVPGASVATSSAKEVPDPRVNPASGAKRITARPLCARASRAISAGEYPSPPMNRAWSLNEKVPMIRRASGSPGSRAAPLSPIAPPDTEASSPANAIS